MLISCAYLRSTTVLNSVLNTCIGTGIAHDEASSSSGSSSESSSSPELERWGTPSCDLGALPADTVAHAAAAAVAVDAAAAQGGGEGAVRSLETSLGGTPSRRDAADRAAAEPSSGLQLLGETNVVTLSEETAERSTGGAEEAEAAGPVSEMASAAAGSSVLPDKSARHGPASDAQSPRLSVSIAAAHEQDAGSMPALTAPQQDEARDTSGSCRSFQQRSLLCDLAESSKLTCSSTAQVASRSNPNPPFSPPKLMAILDP